MKTFSTMMVGLVMLLVACCAGAVEPTSVAPTVEVSGKWAGTWVGTELVLGNGAIEMTLRGGVGQQGECHRAQQHDGQSHGSKETA